MIKYFLTVFKDGDKMGKNVFCKSKDDALEKAEHVRELLHKGDKVMMCYGDFDEKDNHLKGGAFYYLDSWEA